MIDDLAHYSNEIGFILRSKQVDAIMMHRQW